MIKGHDAYVYDIVGSLSLSGEKFFSIEKIGLYKYKSNSIKINKNITNNNNQEINIFSNDIQEFLTSLSLQSVEILMNRYQSNLESGVTDKESFEKEVRSMSTYEKYVRRKRYKKLPAVFSV